MGLWGPIRWLRFEKVERKGKTQCEKVWKQRGIKTHSLWRRVLFELRADFTIQKDPKGHTE